MSRSQVDKVGEAIRAAVMEGYIQGVCHPMGRSVMAEAKRIADVFWRRVQDEAEGRLTARRPAHAAEAGGTPRPGCVRFASGADFFTPTGGDRV